MPTENTTEIDNNIEEGANLTESSTETESQETTETPSAETTVTTGGTEGNTTKPEGKDDSGSEVPFNENPKFKERIAQIDQKYGNDAKNWNAVSRIAAKDPEFALVLIKKMEDEGEAPAGTYEAAKKQLESKVKEKETKNEGSSKEVDLENNEDIKFARRLRQQQEASERKKAEDLDNWVLSFEKDKPELDVSTNSNAMALKAAIGSEANLLMAKDKNLSIDDAFKQAYRWVVKREEVLKEYKENGEIDGRLSNAQESMNAPVKGTNVSEKPSRQLDSEEQEGAKMMGVTHAEYLRLINDPDSGVVK